MATLTDLRARREALAPPESAGARRIMFAWILSLFGRWLSLAGATVATLGIAWFKGSAAGKAVWEKRSVSREKAMQQSTEIRHHLQNDSDAALDRRLDHWMRD